MKAQPFRIRPAAAMVEAVLETFRHRTVIDGPTVASDLSGNPLCTHVRAWDTVAKDMLEWMVGAGFLVRLPSGWHVVPHRPLPTFKGILGSEEVNAAGW